MRIYKWILALICFYAFIVYSDISLFACENLTVVRTQRQFDEAMERVNKGEEMHITLRPGHYSLKEPVNAKAPLSLLGKHAVISRADIVYTPDKAINVTPTHYVYRRDTICTVFPLFYNRNDELIELSKTVVDSLGVNYIEGKIESQSGFSAGIQLKIPIAPNLSHLKNNHFSYCFGYFDCGWQAVNFQLNYSDDNFFYCTTLTHCATKNYNYDRTAYNKRIRVVLYNAELKQNGIYYDEDYLYVPKRVKKLYVVCSEDNNTFINTYSDVSIEGVGFYGGIGITIYSGKKNVCRILDCHFRNSLGNALTIQKENGVDAETALVKECSFNDCSQYKGNVVHLESYDNTSVACIELTDCIINRYSSGKMTYKNASGCVWVGGDARIQSNIIYNTCRDHLYLYTGTILAKGNFLYNTDEFISYDQQNSSSDWGLVYCDHIYTKSQDALNNSKNIILLEDNVLYGAYAYGGDARGIFIDDGRGDVSCVNNIVLRTQVFSIDSRNSTITQASSVRNRYEKNIVASNYRLAAGSAVMNEDVPVTNSNILLSLEPNIINNVRVIEDDTILKVPIDVSCSGNYILVNDNLYGIIKNSQAWKTIQKFVRRRF